MCVGVGVCFISLRSSKVEALEAAVEDGEDCRGWKMGDGDPDFHILTPISFFKD